MQICEIKKCEEILGPGSSKIGYRLKDQVREVKVCPFHTMLIMTSPRGSFIITEEKVLKAIPATRYFT